MSIAFKDLQAYAKELASVVREHVGDLRRAWELRADQQDARTAQLEQTIKELTDANAAMRKELDDTLSNVQSLLRIEADAIRSTLPEPPDVDAIAQKAAALVDVTQFDIDGDAIARKAAEFVQVPAPPAVDVDDLARKAAALVPVPAAPVVDVDDIARKAAALVEVPTPEPGKPGADGRDAIDLEILPEIDSSKSYPRNTYARHAGGLWRSFQATTGMHGWECLVRGVVTVEAHLGEGRALTIESVLSDGERKTFTTSVPFLIDRGPYSVERSYAAGDGVTFGGSYWIAQDQEPTGKPGEPGSKGWRLAVRRGRDASSTAKFGGDKK